MDLEAVSSYRVLVVGDAIEDRYRHCVALGRGTKEPIISVKMESEEVFKGGVWASAAHIKDLCSKVDVWHGDKVTINTKYIGAYGQKLFSVHESRPCLDHFMIADIAYYDLVVVFDYGYGFLIKELREKIMKESRYLAVNAQSNSLNYGFNRINEKWPKADFAVCDELEARLAAHDQEGEITDVIHRLPYKSLIVTQGAKGATGYRNGEFCREPAHTDRPVDLLGAGDAVLAVVAPFAKAGFSIKELVHLGNVAGAVKVGITGHQKRVMKEDLEKML